MIVESIVGIKESIFRSQRHFTQQHNTNVIGLVCKAVVGALAAHVGEIDTLAKHVACTRSFGRGDSEALTENAHPVCEARTVPEELPVTDRLPDVRQVLADRKCIENLKCVVVVCRGMRVVQISADS